MIGDVTIAMNTDYIEARRDYERDSTKRGKKVIKQDPSFLRSIAKYSKEICPEKKERIRKINNRRYDNASQ